MKTFEEFIKSKEVKEGSPDVAQADSLFLQGIARLEDLVTLPLKETNASFRFEDAYESIRELLQAFMAREGYKPYSHEAVFVFAHEKELLTEPEFMRWNRYREKRNDIHYRAKAATVEETQEIIEHAKELAKRLKTSYSWSE